MSKYSGISRGMRSKNKYNDDEDDEIIQNRSILSKSKKSKFDIDEISEID
jgi:hypothetical protein